MNDRQYQVLLDMYHERNKDFWHLPASTLDAFFKRLFSK